MSSLTPEQKAKLMELFQADLSGGIFIPRDVAEKVRKALDDLTDLYEDEEIFMDRLQWILNCF